MIFLNVNKKLFILVAVVIILLISFFRFSTNTNERSRFLMTHAIVSQGELNINKGLKKFGNSLDKAKYKNNYFSDKAPSMSIASVPVYATYYYIFGKDLTEKNSYWIIKAFLLAPLAILLFWLIYSYTYGFSEDKQFSLFIAAASLFATPIASYFSVLFSHSFTAVLLFLFFLSGNKLIKKNRWYLYFLLGILGGVIFQNEYQTAVPLAILSLYFFFRMEQKSLYLYFVFGVGVMATLFFLYNINVFGSAFSVGVTHADHVHFKEIHSKGLYGITIPKWSTILMFLGHMGVGIFSLSPFIAFAGVGIYSRFKENIKETIVLVLIILSYFYMMASLANPRGGWAIGARYLVPIFPFLVILAAFESHILSA